MGRSRHPSLAFIFSPKVYPNGYSPFFHDDKIKDEDHSNATIINKNLSPSTNNAHIKKKSDVLEENTLNNSSFNQSITGS